MLCRSRTARNTSVLALLGVLLLLVSCISVSADEPLPAVAMSSFFAKEDGYGNKVASGQLCSAGGGFLPSVTNDLMHAAMVETAEAYVGSGRRWFAFMGASTEAMAHPNDCPPDHFDDPTGGAAFLCAWRWNQGHWLDVDDTVSSKLLYVPRAGVTFFTGNLWFQGAKPTPLPNYFDMTNSEESQRRPSTFLGRHLVAVGSGSGSATWSDNSVSGGYTYEDFNYSRVFGESKFNKDSAANTESDFVAVCVVQVPTRDTYEVTNTSSKLQNLWWVIFLVILFVVLLVVFIVIACCQENEDEDEPPEDAPKWVGDQQRSVQHPQRFASSRSFRQVDDYNRYGNGGDGGDGDDYEDNASYNESEKSGASNNNNNNTNPLQHSARRSQESNGDDVYNFA